MVLAASLSSASPHHHLLIPGGGKNPNTLLEETRPDALSFWRSRQTDTHAAAFTGDERAVLFISYSTFLDQTGFGIQCLHGYFSSPLTPCPLPRPLFFKGSRWAIDFLWLAHLVLIIAHFLPGISWEQLSDKLVFRQCYLATAHFLPHLQQRVSPAAIQLVIISVLQTTEVK